jgi:hypothetical protein
MRARLTIVSGREADASARTTRTRSTTVFRRKREAPCEDPQAELVREISAVVDVARSAHKLGVSAQLEMHKHPERCGSTLVLCVDEPAAVRDMHSGEVQRARMFKPMYTIFFSDERLRELQGAVRELQLLCKITEETRWMIASLLRRGRYYL